MYEKVVIIAQIWHRAKCYFTSMNNTWYLITVQNMATITMFLSEISQQTFKMYDQMVIITQIWHEAKFYYMHQQTMVADHGTKYEENPFSYHEGMCKDSLTD